MTSEAARELHAAIEILCASPECTAVRLGTSYQRHLRKLEPRTLPASVRAEFRAILDDLRRMFPAPDRFDGIAEAVAAETTRRLLLAYDRMIDARRRDR